MTSKSLVWRERGSCTSLCVVNVRAVDQVHNEWAQTSGDLSGSTAILSTFQDGVLIMAGVGDSGETTLRSIVP